MHLDDMDTVLVGGLIPRLTGMMEQKYGDPEQTVNFTGCISGIYDMGKRKKRGVLTELCDKLKLD